MLRPPDKRAARAEVSALLRHNDTKAKACEGSVATLPSLYILRLHHLNERRINGNEQKDDYESNDKSRKDCVD